MTAGSSNIPGLYNSWEGKVKEKLSSISPSRGSDRLGEAGEGSQVRALAGKAGLPGARQRAQPGGGLPALLGAHASEGPGKFRNES